MRRRSKSTPHIVYNKIVVKVVSTDVNEKLLEELLKSVRFGGPKGDCWIRGEDSSVYTSIKYNGRQVAAHKAAFEIFTGSRFDGFDGLHRCDVRACINPDHVFRGTDVHNSKDAIHKGRTFSVGPKVKYDKPLTFHGPNIFRKDLVV